MAAPAGIDRASAADLMQLATGHGGADVEVTRRGCLRPMHALLDEDPASVAVSYQAMIDRIGWRKAQRQLGISRPGGRAPTALELKDAARECGWSVITLTPR